MSLREDNYINILESLKQKIRQARIKAVLSVNTDLLLLYWEIGNTILQQQKSEGWGAKVIDNLSADLRREFPDLKGLSVRNLKYMRAFASAYPWFSANRYNPKVTQATEIQDDIIVQADLAQLSWYHHITILDKIKETPTRAFYINETVKNSWSRDVLVHQIESGLHQRIGKISSNFKTTIGPEHSELVQQLFKDPYKFEFIYLGKEAKERDLEDALMNQLTKFLLEFGQYFAFMGRQYKMQAGEREYYFDLLFYHTRLKRYIVIELLCGAPHNNSYVA